MRPVDYLVVFLLQLLTLVAGAWLWSGWLQSVVRDVNRALLRIQAELDALWSRPPPAGGSKMHVVPKPPERRR